jgi:glycerol-3-phosphate dehydrogenase
MNLVTRQLFPTYAVGVPGQNSYQDSDALLKKGSSLLFIAPWRDKSLIGTSYTVCEQDPDNFKVTDKDIQLSIARSPAL